MKRRKGDGKCFTKKPSIYIVITQIKSDEILKSEVFRMKHLKLYDVER